MFSPAIQAAIILACAGSANPQLCQKNYKACHKAKTLSEQVRVDGCNKAEKEAQKKGNDTSFPKCMSDSGGHRLNEEEILSECSGE